jgi:hypothetical protein
VDEARRNLMVPTFLVSAFGSKTGGGASSEQDFWVSSLS